MKKYFLFAKNTWDETLVYRLNFTMWRVRVILQLLTTYFLWLAILPSDKTLFGYTQSMMLTYILGTSLLSSIVLSSRSQDVGEQINSGDLSNFLIRPINFFLAWFARDAGDKAMNIAFSITEVSILFFILKPPVFFQKDPLLFLFSFLAIMLAIIINFFFNLLLGAIGFWSSEVWAPRFIFFIVMTFFAGGLFPLDILPKQIFLIFQFLPFPYFLYFPIKVYLGQLVLWQIYMGLMISFLWTILLFIIVRFVWLKGLTGYTSEGR